jgi:hypothetical protein
MVLDPLATPLAKALLDAVCQGDWPTEEGTTVAKALLEAAGDQITYPRVLGWTLDLTWRLAQDAALARAARVIEACLWSRMGAETDGVAKAAVALSVAAVQTLFTELKRSAPGPFALAPPDPITLPVQTASTASRANAPRRVAPSDAPVKIETLPYQAPDPTSGYGASDEPPDEPV